MQGGRSSRAAVSRPGRFAAQVPGLERVASGRGAGDLCDSYFFKACSAIGILAYADSANMLSVSTFGYDTQIKYAYFLFAVSLYAVTVLTTSRLSMGLDGPSIMVFFTVVSVTALLLQIFSQSQNDSYAGAFLATLVLSTAGMFDVRKHRFDIARVTKAIQRFLLILSILYVLELAIRMFSGLAYFENVLNQTNHIKSFVLVASICLAVLLRDSKSLALAAVLFVASQILRPSSSLISGVAVCAPVSFAISRGWLGTAKTFAYAVILLAAFVPIALYLSPDLKTFVTGAESWTKEDLLQGTSNTFFRLAIQDMAIDRLQDTSVAFGVMFSQANSVQLSDKFGWWLQYTPSGLAAIHSDYVSVLFQSGVVGYFFYNLALLLTCRTLFQGLARARASRKPCGIMGLSVCSVLALVFYSSSNPFLQYYTIASVAWFLIAIGYIQMRYDRELPAMAAATTEQSRSRPPA